MCGTAAQHRQTSNGAAMLFKRTNSISGTTAHRDTFTILWASGDAQTHTLTPALLPHCRIAVVVGVGKKGAYVEESKMSALLVVGRGSLLTRGPLV